MTDSVPTDRELQALKVLWEHGEATVRDIWKLLSAADRDLAYTTALSLMQVMEQKGLVGHRADGRTYVYSARVDRKSVLLQFASGLLEKVFDGAVDEYLVHALESHHPSPAEFDRLEQMIAEAKVGASRKRKGKRP
jgi:BlaI family transcriptional regulator, penicillinase repressor